MNRFLLTGVLVVLVSNLAAAPLNAGTFGLFTCWKRTGGVTCYPYNAFTPVCCYSGNPGRCMPSCCPAPVPCCPMPGSAFEHTGSACADPMMMGEPVEMAWDANQQQDMSPAPEAGSEMTARAHPTPAQTPRAQPVRRSSGPMRMPVGPATQRRTQARRAVDLQPVGYRRQPQTNNYNPAHPHGFYHGQPYAPPSYRRGR